MKDKAIEKRDLYRSGSWQRVDGARADTCEEWPTGVAQRCTPDCPSQNKNKRVTGASSQMKKRSNRNASGQ
jgi:hypothetical protein